MPVNAPARQSGAMLIESLVAITLLATALGGSALLLVHALRLERDSALRTAALRHGASLADLLRGLVRTDGSPLQSVTNPAAPLTCPLAARDCLVDTLAARRIEEWHVATLASLPAGSRAQVDVANVVQPAYLVTIAWPGSAPDAESRLQLAVEP